MSVISTLQFSALGFITHLVTRPVEQHVQGCRVMHASGKGCDQRRIVLLGLPAELAVPHNPLPPLLRCGNELRPRAQQCSAFLISARKSWR